jgi:hypothetical protein
MNAEELEWLECDAAAAAAADVAADASGETIEKTAQVCGRTVAYCELRGAAAGGGVGGYLWRSEHALADLMCGRVLSETARLLARPVRLAEVGCGCALAALAAAGLRGVVGRVVAMDGNAAVVQMARESSRRLIASATLHEESGHSAADTAVPAAATAAAAATTTTTTAETEDVAVAVEVFQSDWLTGAPPLSGSFDVVAAADVAYSCEQEDMDALVRFCVSLLPAEVGGLLVFVSPSERLGLPMLRSSLQTQLPAGSSLVEQCWSDEYVSGLSGSWRGGSERLLWLECRVGCAKPPLSASIESVQ